MSKLKQLIGLQEMRFLGRSVCSVIRASDFPQAASIPQRPDDCRCTFIEAARVQQDPPSPSTTTGYLSCEQAGKHLNLSPRTLEKMRTIGGGPIFRKLGRRVMYRIADLDAWADEHACESTSDPSYVGRKGAARCSGSSGE